jgi:RNA polymerase sigma factor (sigma-70 family)
MASPLTERSTVLGELRPIIRRTLTTAGVPARAIDDAEQRTLTALTPHVGKLREMEFRMRGAYAYQAAMRVGIRMRRRLAGEPVDEVVLETAMDQRASADDAIVLGERVRRVTGALAELDPREREVIDRMFDGKTEREAAEELGLSRGAVAYRLRQARLALARAWHGTTSWLAGKNDPE